MPLTPEELRQIAARTLAHYDQRAQDFWEGTRDHDVSQNIAALLQHIETAPPFELLDFGCGPGRDLRTFTALGHRATGLEGSPQLAAMAREHSGCEVIEQDFLALDLPAARFDGVFANAVLFHVPGRNCRACSDNCTRRSRPTACSSARTRAATVRRAGMATATAPATTGNPGGTS